MVDNKITNIQIVIFALSVLGGANTKVHTEHIANKCLEIAPDRFKWEYYNYPNKDLIRRILITARDAKDGALVTGRTGIEQKGKLRDGWQLTPEGIIWLKQQESVLKSLTASGEATDVLPRREAERFVKKFKSEAVFQTFLFKRNLAGVSRYVFTDLLNCSPDASTEIIRTKFDRLVMNAELVNDKDVLLFLEECKKNYANLLEPL